MSLLPNRLSSYPLLAVAALIVTTLAAVLTARAGLAVLGLFFAVLAAATTVHIAARIR